MTMLQRVIHKCALCKELLLLDSDTIAMHLKSKHKGVSHKEYNARHMVMGGRMAGREESGTGQKAELEEEVMEVSPGVDSEEKLSREIEQLEKQLLKGKTDQAKLCEKEMKELSMVLVKNEASVSKAKMNQVDLRPERMSTEEKIDNFMTRLRPGVDISGEFSMNEVEGGGEEEEEATLEEGSTDTAERKDKMCTDPNESVRVETNCCLECGLKLASKADLLKHLQSEHYQQYLQALAKQFFPGSDCVRCGEVVEAGVAIQLIHIGEKHRQFPRQTIILLTNKTNGILRNNIIAMIVSGW